MYFRNGRRCFKYSKALKSSGFFWGKNNNFILRHKGTIIVFPIIFHKVWWNNIYPDVSNFDYDCC